MKSIISAVLIAYFITGCTVSGIQETTPILDSITSKSSKEYSDCVQADWLSINYIPNIVKSKTGHQLILLNPAWGTVSILLRSDDKNDGSVVKMFSALSYGYNDLLKGAKECL